MFGIEGLEIDIGGTIVGAITLIVLALQIHGQSNFSKRIADLEYIKLIEPKLLAILYKNRKMDFENGGSSPSFDYYKFHFFMGILVEAAPRGGVAHGSRLFIKIHDDGKLNEQYFKDNAFLEKYCELYENTVKCIKTKDIKNTFVDSEFGEVFRVIKNSFHEKAS